VFIFSNQFVIGFDGHKNIGDFIESFKNNDKY
jgi:hypothetical protein